MTEDKAFAHIARATAELAEAAGLDNKDQTVSKRFEWRDDFSKWSECEKEMKARKDGNLRFIAHYKHTIKGKAQLVNQNKQQLTFLTRVKVNRDKIEVRCFGESVDKRKDEIQKVLSEYVWIYRVVSDSKEYTVLSFKELGSEVYSFRGMNIRLTMPTEISKQLSLKGFANVFLCYSAEPAIKILNRRDLISLTKKTGLSVTDFIKYNFVHPSGILYEQPEEYMVLRSVQLLSGKYEGYPLHSLTFGPPGTGKSMEVESLDHRFKEDEGILEAANSRPKSLVPSFKENPASPGYILRCNRLALVDELMKMIEAAATGTRQQESVQNLLSQMNMLLEHKLRTIGSGNANFMRAQATAKLFAVTNSFPFKRTLADHTSVIDTTVLSRMLPYCQDQKHLQFLAEQKSGNTLNSINQKSGNTYKIYIDDTINDIFTNPTYTTYSLCVTTKFIDADDYLTIIDSSNSFLVGFEIEPIKKLYQTCCNLLQNQNLKQIFAARGIHHLVLLFDGLVKLRCLFRDYDSSFKATQEDYETLERIIFFILNTWTADLTGGGSNDKILF